MFGEDHMYFINTKYLLNSQPLLYTKLFEPCAIFAPLHLQTILPNLELHGHRCVWREII